MGEFQKLFTSLCHLELEFTERNPRKVAAAISMNGNCKLVEKVLGTKRFQDLYHREEVIEISATACAILGAFRKHFDSTNFLQRFHLNSFDNWIDIAEPSAHELLMAYNELETWINEHDFRISLDDYTARFRNICPNDLPV